MQGPTTQSHRMFLDISELVLQEHQPNFRPQLSGLNNQALEIEHFDLDSDPSLSLSPMFADLPLEEEDLAYDLFFTDCYDLCGLEEIYLEDHLKMEKKVWRSRRKNGSVSSNQFLQPLEFLLENNLDDIIDQAKNFGILESEMNEFSESESEQSGEEFSNTIEDDAFSNIELYDEEDFQSRKDEKISENTVPLENESSLLKKWETANPKKQLLTRIKSCFSKAQGSQQQKIEETKNILEQYVFDFQKFYLNESFGELKQSPDFLPTIIRGIEQTFKKTIGGVSFDKRRIKLLKYMDKKKKRDWKKKVNYDCRKKVADGRLRFKGKFVTEKKKAEEEMKCCEQKNEVPSL